MTECTLIFGPVLLNLIEIVIVKRMIEMFRILIMKRTSTAKLILFPLSVIGQPLRLIEQFSITLNMSINPLSFIHPSILIIKSTYSMFDTIYFISLISTTLSICLPNILSQSITLSRIGCFIIIQITHWFLFYTAFVFIIDYILVNICMCFVGVGREYVAEGSGCRYITWFENWYWLWDHWSCVGLGWMWRRWMVEDRERLMGQGWGWIVEGIPWNWYWFFLEEQQFGLGLLRCLQFRGRFHFPKNLLQKILILFDCRLVILLNLNNMLFQFRPIRSRSLIFRQHKFQ